MKQKVLILGGGGFVGSALISALERTSWAKPIPASRRNGVNITRTADVEHALEGIDAIVNCVAGKPDAIAQGAQVLVQAAQRMPVPPRLIHLSSMVVYGAVSGDVTESAALDGSQSPYAQAKVGAEIAVADYPRAVILRPGIIYGPGSTQWSGRIASWLRSGRIGDLGEAAEGYCNLVYIGDLVQVILAALQSPAEVVEGHSFNLSLSSPPIWNEYLLRYAQALGVAPARISQGRLTLETRLLAVPLKLIEVVASKVGAQTFMPPITPSLPALLRQRIRLKTDAVEAALLPRWMPLGTGLAEAAAWVEGHHPRPVGAWNRS